MNTSTFYDLKNNLRNCFLVSGFTRLYLFKNVSTLLKNIKIKSFDNSTIIQLCDLNYKHDNHDNLF